jgi:hypothetical protein
MEIKGGKAVYNRYGLSAALQRAEGHFARPPAGGGLAGGVPLTLFRTVYMPLAMPGIVAGWTLVFVLSLGYYVTPALVGGPGDQMIGYFVAYFTNSAVNWGMASALGSLLLLIIGAIYFVLSRAIGLDRLLGISHARFVGAADLIINPRLDLCIQGRYCPPRIARKAHPPAQ